MRLALRSALPTRLSTLLPTVAAGLAALALVVVPAAADPAAPAAEAAAGVSARSDLTAAVARHLVGQQVSGSSVADGRFPVVTVTRETEGWAMGTAVLAGAPGGKLPYGWLFVARRTDKGTWQFGLEGEPAFASIAGASPLSTPTERTLFGADPADRAGTQQAGGDYRTGMQLPWSTGVAWTMSGGPHGWAGTDTPYSSLDLHGGDQVVRAVRAGTAYTMCRGWLRVFHDRGYATDYYHLWNNINVNGAAVGAGARLGDTGTDVTCGGAASGRHVHFALRQNNVYVGIGGHNLGGWVPIAGGAYAGYALHGSTVRYPGGGIHNYGALGFNQGIIDGNGGTVINKRSGPGTGYALVGTVNDGTTVTVSCSANGTSHAGRWGTTSLWNRLSDGTWVTDAFMWTGLSGPIAGYC
jgi:LasA protease